MVHLFLVAIGVIATMGLLSRFAVARKRRRALEDIDYLDDQIIYNRKYTNSMRDAGIYESTVVDDEIVSFQEQIMVCRNWLDRSWPVILLTNPWS